MVWPAACSRPRRVCRRITERLSARSWSAHVQVLVLALSDGDGSRTFTALVWGVGDVRRSVLRLLGNDGHMLRRPFAENAVVLLRLTLAHRTSAALHQSESASRFSCGLLRFSCGFRSIFSSLPSAGLKNKTLKNKTLSGVTLSLNYKPATKSTKVSSGMLHP